MENGEAAALGFTVERKVDSLSGYTYYVYTKEIGNYMMTMVNYFEGPWPIVIYRGSIIPHVHDMTYGEQIFKGKIGNGELVKLFEQLK